MKTAEDEEFERIEAEGWRKRQIALDQKAENARELGLDYELEHVATVISESGANVTHSWWHEPALPIGTKLYTLLPQRTWVGLTRDEQNFVYRNLHNSTSRKDSFWVDFANAIGQAIKEKNT